MFDQKLATMALGAAIGGLIGLWIGGVTIALPGAAIGAILANMLGPRV